jgi:hypothetical protein
VRLSKLLPTTSAPEFYNHAELFNELSAKEQAVRRKLWCLYPADAFYPHYNAQLPDPGDIRVRVGQCHSGHAYATRLPRALVFDLASGRVDFQENGAPGANVTFIANAPALPTGTQAKVARSLGLSPDALGRLVGGVGCCEVFFVLCLAGFWGFAIARFYASQKRDCAQLLRGFAV